VLPRKQRHPAGAERVLTGKPSWKQKIQRFVVFKRMDKNKNKNLTLQAYLLRLMLVFDARLMSRLQLCN